MQPATGLVIDLFRDGGGKADDIMIYIMSPDERMQKKFDTQTDELRSICDEFKIKGDGSNRTSEK